MATPETITQAGLDFHAEIVDVLGGDDGKVHGETAIADAGRMAGTFLLRSLDLPLDGLEPGTQVFSSGANDLGPLLIKSLFGFLKRMGIEIDPERLESFTGKGGKPR